MPRSTTAPPSVSELSALLALLSPGLVFDAARDFFRAGWDAFTPRAAR